MGGPVPPPIAPVMPQRTETTSVPPPPPPLLSQMYPSYLHYSAPPAAFYFPAQSYPAYTDFVALPPPPNTPMGMPLGSLSFGSGYYSNSSSTLPSSTSSSKPGAAVIGEQLVTTTSKKPTAFIKGQSTSKKATDMIKKQGTGPHSGGPPNSSGLKSSTSSADHRYTWYFFALFIFCEKAKKKLNSLRKKRKMRKIFLDYFLSI